MQLSKHQERKWERYGKQPSYSSAQLLFRNEVNEIREILYRKPGQKSLPQAVRDTLIEVESKGFVQV